MSDPAGTAPTSSPQPATPMQAGALSSPAPSTPPGSVTTSIEEVVQAEVAKYLTKGIDTLGSKFGPEHLALVVGLAATSAIAVLAAVHVPVPNELSILAGTAIGGGAGIALPRRL